MLDLVMRIFIFSITASSTNGKKNGRYKSRRPRQQQYPPTESESDVTGTQTDDSLMSGRWLFQHTHLIREWVI